MPKHEFMPQTWPSERWPNFTFDEMRCTHSLLCYLDPDFMDVLQEIRTAYNRPMVISSGYRHLSHPVEAKKDRPGSHYEGVAADVLVNGSDAVDLLRIILDSGAIHRIGFDQRASTPWNERFIHIDRNANRPAAIWSYG